MAKVKDPICGMMVDTERTPYRLTDGPATVYFCAASCRSAYAKAHPTAR